MKASKTLSDFDVRRRFGAPCDGAAAIGESVGSHATLETLMLSRCAIGAAGRTPTRRSEASRTR